MISARAASLRTQFEMHAHAHTYTHTWVEKQTSRPASPIVMPADDERHRITAEALPSQPVALILVTPMPIDVAKQDRASPDVP